MLANASDPRSRVNAHDFSRDCKLTPELLVVLLLFMVGDSNRRGYRHILDAFWDECSSHGVPLPTETPVTASAFCQARAKLSDDLLRHLLHDAAAKMESTFRSASHWRGRRVFAVDGCKLNLQRSDELDARFGRPECGHVPQATLSALVNVMTRIPTDVVIGPYGACERQLLASTTSACSTLETYSFWTAAIRPTKCCASCSTPRSTSSSGSRRRTRSTPSPCSRRAAVTTTAS